MRNFLIILLTQILFLPILAFADSDILQYQVTATKLDKSRNALSPSTGGSSYSFKQEDIEKLPQGQATSLNQVLLRAPGVTQDSYGQIHVRQDHSNLQYRINGVVVPEGISGFGQSFDTHFADSVNFLTGALPAQYGYRTAGVVDIKTKSGAFANGGRTEVTMGSNNTLGFNQQISGSKDKLNYYISASYLENSRGIEAPTNARKTIHNDTKQDKLFGYFSYLLDAQTRLSLIVANADNRFQIPNNPNQNAAFSLRGASAINSSSLNQKQNESNRYVVASLQGVTDAEIDYQISTFTRYSSVNYRSDYVGDLVFNGVAADIDRTSLVSGLQSDFSYKLNDANTLRSGLSFSEEQTKSYKNSFVFAVDADGEATSDVPLNIENDSSKANRLASLYLQNEWKVFEKLTLNYGARFDGATGYINDHQLSPRFGGVYDISNDTKLHAGFARYFTLPRNELLTTSTLEKFAGTTNAASNLVNDKVKPERSNYYDLGLTHKLNSHINLGLDAYYKEVKDLLDEGQFGQALIYTPFNYDRAKVYGIEFTSDYHKDDFSAFFNLALQDTKAKKIISSQYLFESDELAYISGHNVHLDHDQRISASAGLSYLFYATRYSVDGIFGSGLRKGFSNTEHLPSYTQINFGAARDMVLPIVNKFNARFSVINLFDRSYAIRDGSGIGVGAPQYAMRRAFFVTISKSF